MKALISPQENNRICAIAETAFPVASPLHWVDCPEQVTTDWLYDGYAFVAPTEKASTEEPIVLSPTQIRFVLNAHGLRESVESIVSTSDQTIKDWWEFSTKYVQGHPVLVAVAGQLGLSDEQVDAMFREGVLM